MLFINNILPSPVSVALTGKPIQGLLDYVFVFSHHSCQLSTVTAPMTQWYLSFPFLSTPWKLKFGRMFSEAVNCTLRSIGTGSGSLIRASAVTCIQKPGVQSVSNDFSLVGSDHHDGLNKNISERTVLFFFFLSLIFPSSVGEQLLDRQDRRCAFVYDLSPDACLTYNSIIFF